MPKPPILAAALALLVLAVPDARADAIDATYEVRFAGVRIATARISGSIQGSNYAMTLNSNYSVLVSSGAISGRVSGGLAGDRPFPRSYFLGGGNPEQSTALSFSGRGPATVRISPPLPADWNTGRIALQPGHQRGGVLDPMSAVVFAALRAGASPESACRTTIPVFTGVNRFDVVLSPGSPSPGRRGQAQAAAVIPCRARFVPIAGHRPQNQTIRALVGSSIRVDFESTPTGRVRMPARIEIPTRYGTVSIVRQS